MGGGGAAEGGVGAQLILAYSWARPAVLVADKSRRGNIVFSSVPSLPFIFLFLPSFISSSISSLFFLSLRDNTK